MLTESLRSQIAERKEELLAFLRDNSAPAAFMPPPVIRQTTGKPAPLSFAQERLWFLEQLEPGSVVYNICRALRLTGNLNISALESSLNEIVRRHEVLRSVIRVADEQSVQVAEPPYALKLLVIDLRAVSDIDREPEIRQRIQQAAETPFDFAAGKFLRAELLRLGDDEHILILTTHHIVSDAWSMGILTRELWSRYKSNATGASSPFKELPIQYADFATWQRDWLRGEVLESQVSYWKKQLNDLPILNLPTDRPRPARQSFLGARAPITLPESLTSAINELSNQCGVTPFMTLLTAFQVLLYRYCAQEDLVVGSAVANRARPELEPLIGFFVNTLVLRTDLSGNPSFKELIARVRDVCLGAYTHQNLPFEKLVQELHPERDQSRNPLFQVMLVLQNAPRPLSQSGTLNIQNVELQSFRSQFDLSLFLRERDGRYIGYFEYSTDLFDCSTIERMAGHLQILLEGIIANCDQLVATLPLLTDAERHQLLVEWNSTAADYPQDKCIHELFEEQAERTPDRVAVVFEGQQLAYRELNTRANLLAHYLYGRGVGPETLVGICVERSLEMVIGLLGILKAGGAYVPLDPAYPKERLRFMLEDSQVSVVVTQENLLDSCQVSAVSLPPVYVCLDRDWPVIARHNAENFPGQVDSHNLAYVIYTSGSTGQPKGVAIKHWNTINLLHWAKTIYTAQELRGVLASTSICFDLSVFELFVPLSWGGKVELVENTMCLFDQPAPRDMTLINTVPSVMTALLSAGRLPDNVRIVNLAGEPLRPELVKQIYDIGSVEKVYDLYGPSETTTYSTFTLRSVDGPGTIGRPISNTQIYLLDSRLQPVPIGVPGELYIGGGGVARGYLNRPERTKEQFVGNPFNDNPDSRIYRTGDRARYLPDGNLQFLGRSDNQIKLRGYRIELEEIEAVLNQHPAVKESIVLVGDRDSSEEKELIGYVVPRERWIVAGTELRNFLKDKLPGYMVPAAFDILDALPIFPNGKIDRSKLPAPKPSFNDVTVTPRTEIEELVTQIWRDVLKAETIGVHDNFFELGGHSLLAIQIISRIREAFDKEVPLSVLFDAPTIAGLAATIEKTISGRTHDLPPIVRAPRDRPLPLSMNQEHLWRLDRMLPGTHFFNMPYVYRLCGDLNISALEQTLQEIIRRHEALRTIFAEIDDRPVQVINEVPDFQLPCIDLRGESADEVSQKAAGFILEEREGPFDLASGPLLRIKLLCLTDTEYLLLVTMHHIISDHWSMQLFWTELATLYVTVSQAQASSLADPVIQFAEYACWERQLLDKGLLNGQLAYWKSQLAGPLPQLELKKAGEVPKVLSFRTSRQILEFDESLYSGIKFLARKEHCTPFMVLVAALSIVLHHQTGQQDIRIGTLVANRRQRETGRVIGHFLNTVILRTMLFPDMTCKCVLKLVREVTLAAYANEELPFEQLARVLQEELNILPSSLFHVFLTYQRSIFQSHNLPGVTFASLGGQLPFIGPELLPTAFDLIVNVRETSTKFTGSVNYKTDAINADDVHIMSERLFAVIQSLVFNIDRLVSGIHFDASHRPNLRR